MIWTRAYTPVAHALLDVKALKDELGLAAGAMNVNAQYIGGRADTRFAAAVFVSRTASGSSSLTYRPQITHLGRAVAALNLSGDRPVSSTLTIILLPIKAGVSTLLAIGIIYFVIRTTNKKPKQPRPIEGSEPKKVRNLQSSTTLPNHPTIKPSNH